MVDQHIMDIPLSDQDRQVIDTEYRLATIRDLIEAAEEQGMEWVALPTDDARWLVSQVKDQAA